MSVKIIYDLLLKFKEVAGEDSFISMYDRKNLDMLVESFNRLCCDEKDEKDEKSGLKVNLNGVFKKSIKTLKRHYSATCEDEKHKEMKRFAEAYSDRTPELLAKARYSIGKTPLLKARLPKNLPRSYSAESFYIF